ncbi:hypothetical protein COCNU_03G000840 [Cocos nucifera]|uniref:F-box domain-containing protein n=1 Tax=Cocos nucifera TaxID=13894 RepID=A0A8K0I2A1_COCNU|nr:hypothetical protein COCNU_03G000840 [Cocos nucifera]
MAVTTCCFFPKIRRILRRNKDEATRNDGRSWLDLPDYLLTIIVSRLSSEDYVRFATTCRRWQSFPDPRSRPIWLIFLGECNGDCVIVDPFCTKVHNNLSFPELAGVRVLWTRAGWLLLFRDNTLFFFCPSNREQRSLQDAGWLECFRASFSSSSISSDCTVVVLRPNENSGNEALTWRPGECNWNVVHLYRFCDTSARFCGRCIYQWLGHIMLMKDPTKGYPYGGGSNSVVLLGRKELKDVPQQKLDRRKGILEGTEVVQGVVDPL